VRACRSRPNSLIERFFGGDSAATEDLKTSFPEGAEPLRQSKMLRRMLDQKTLTWMHYRVEVK